MNKDSGKFKSWRRVVLLCAILISLFAACRKSETSDGFDTLLFSDDTTKAAELVADAN